jgi:fructosamine-3-kinase
LSILNPNLTNDWKKAVETATGRDTEIFRVSIVGGGSINDARRIETSEGKFFAKINRATEFPGMFDAELKGLQFLKENSAFNIPEPISTGITEDIQWILMRNIDNASKKENFWELFGQRLAEMHRNSNEVFGLDYDNYLGSLKQHNSGRSDWPVFFKEMRIGPQLELARSQDLISTEMQRLFDKFFSRIERYFPEEPPAAIHGDLWTGNFMTDLTGEAVIFDPAVYYGHREMDLGMSKLFGGFDSRFYAAYHEAFPLEPGWEERIHIANLYPLLAHLNLFGGSYASQIMTILRRHI